MDDKRLDEEFRALVDFARGSRVPTGFGTMSDEGTVDLSRPVELWISARMTHVFALAALYGIEGADDQVAHGIDSLRQYFHDPVYGGWYSSIEAYPADDGNGVPVNDRKEAYAQAFVILAAASGVAAGYKPAALLLADALEQQKLHWADPKTGLASESWNRSFTEQEDYRGANANMHTTEALLAAGDVLGDEELIARAVKILHFIYDQASQNGWRVPEHYTTAWEADWDYNKDQPAHPFRPYGVTPGHSLELSRLMLQARGSLKRLGMKEEDWLLDGALNLGKTSVREGWNADGAPGFVYTTTFEGEPVVHQRMHWVACEAIGQACVLAETLEELGLPEEASAARANADLWWDYAEQYLIERPGQWTHELDRNNQKADGTWSGKPDIYHAAQMTLLPRLPAYPAFAAALREGALRK